MPKEFRGHLTINVSNDGLVYAADRNANRIHVTTREGKFLKEFKLAEHTGVGGATGGVGFSQDKQQRFLYISDLTNNHIYFLDRETGKEVGRMGSMGESGGSFWGLHMIAVDSKGNIYTGEVFARPAHSALRARRQPARQAARTAVEDNAVTLGQRARVKGQRLRPHLCPLPFDLRSAPRSRSPRIRH